MADITVSADVGKNVMELLEKLATTLGTTVDKIYPLYTKQAFISGLVEGGVLLAALSILSVTTFKCLRSENFDDCEPNIKGVLGTVSLVGLVALGIVAAFTASTIFTEIFNPEYYAVRNLLKVLR